MTLSDRERQILDEIEARLREEDPKLARTVGVSTPGASRRGGLRYAVAGFALGLILLLGIVAHIAWGLAGFVLMLASAIYGGSLLTAMNKRGTPARADRLDRRQ
jgi:hypothetical protein